MSQQQWSFGLLERDARLASEFVELFVSREMQGVNTSLDSVAS